MYVTDMPLRNGLTGQGVLALRAEAVAAAGGPGFLRMREVAIQLAEGDNDHGSSWAMPWFVDKTKKP
jgi:hypothetical protein